MIYRLQDTEARNTRGLLVRLCSSCNYTNGQPNNESVAYSGAPFRLVNTERVLDAEWPFICASCAERRLRYPFIEQRRRPGESSGVVMPFINTGFTPDALRGGQFRVVAHAIREPIVFGRTAFLLSRKNQLIESFSVVGRPWSACTKNATCPGCGGATRKNIGGVIARTRANSRDEYELLCQYCSGDIVRFYLKLFSMVESVLRVANTL